MNIIKYNKNKHFDVLFEMWSDLQKLHVEGMPNFCFPVTKKHLISCLKDKQESTKYFLAEINNEIVGYIGYYKGMNGRKKMMNICDVYVKSKYRRNKVAQKLYEYVEEIAKKGKYHSVTCRVYEFNFKSFYFFSKNKFHVVNYQLGKVL